MWPTFEKCEALAKTASDKGFKIKMEPTEKGWSWTWLHEPSGFVFEGDVDTPIKPVAVVCALQGLPVVSG